MLRLWVWDRIISTFAIRSVKIIEKKIIKPTINTHLNFIDLKNFDHFVAQASLSLKYHHKSNKECVRLYFGCSFVICKNKNVLSSDGDDCHLICICQYKTKKVFEANCNSSIVLCITLTESLGKTLNCDTENNKFINWNLFMVFTAIGKILCELWREIESHLSERCNITQISTIKSHLPAGAYLDSTLDHLLDQIHYDRMF